MLVKASNGLLLVVALAALTLTEAAVQPPPTCVHGTLSYSGPNNRVLCKCQVGWKGPLCDEKFTEKDWGPLKRCTQPGEQDNCAEGLQCLDWGDDIGLRCSCDPVSDNPICNPDADLSCTLAGCQPGLTCTYNGCTCVPFSENPLCQCDGKVLNPATNSRTPCTLGEDGYCVMVKHPDQPCNAYQPLPQAPSPDACPTGTQLNSMGQCACVPLSTAPQCLPPPVNQTVSNVCGQFNACTKPYGVTYAVYQSSKTTTSGKAQVDPQKNYLIVTTNIVAGQKYNLCVGLQSTAGWTVRKSACASLDSAGRCCQPVTASKGATSFSAGCAQYKKAFSNPTC